ncbi:hypothetical protein HWV62_29308 [Athelia sp. TMB]|nr:hypothetical protein HWV62_29308 [Athelia sp. TMB]
MTLRWPASGILTAVCEPTPDDYSLCLSVKSVHTCSLLIGFLDASGSVRITQTHEGTNPVEFEGLEVVEKDQCTAHETSINSIRLPFRQRTWREVFLDPGQISVCITISTKRETRVEFLLSSDAIIGVPYDEPVTESEWDGEYFLDQDDPPCGCASAFGMDEDNEIRHYGLDCTYND